MKSTGNSSSIDIELLQKGIHALKKYHEKSSEGKQQLLGDDVGVQVQFGLEIAPIRPSVKPRRIDIPHPIVCLSQENQDSLDEPEVCLIVKDESKPWVQSMIKTHSQHMKFVKKVLRLESLRTKHSQFKQRRELLSKYSVFMADDRIIPMLTKSLGKDFLRAKKQPIPVTLTRKEALPFAIIKALSSTFITVPEGTCATVRAGTTGMSDEKLLQNIQAIVAGAPEKIPRKWANIRSISIKTPTSTALPVYNKTPEELAEIASLAGLSSVWKASQNENKNEEKQQRKRILPTKSPLVKALKKQKKDEESSRKNPNEKKTVAQVVRGESKKDPKSSMKKTTKNSGSSEQEVSPSVKEADNKTKKGDTESSSAKVVKPRKEEKSRKSFISSSKFKGSKKGMVFRRGKDGVGYYLDEPPVVDKMAIEAILRSSHQQKKGRGAGRSKSKKRGGRSGR